MSALGGGCRGDCTIIVTEHVTLFVKFTPNATGLSSKPFPSHAHPEKKKSDNLKIQILKLKSALEINYVRKFYKNVILYLDIS